MLYMHQIKDQVYVINFLLQEQSHYCSQLNSSDFDTENEAKIILDLLKKITQLDEDIWEFLNQTEADCDEDIFLNGYLLKCVSVLSEVLELFSMKELTNSHLEDITDKLFYATVLWSERYIDDFECLYSNLLSRGLYLCSDALIYDKENEQEAFFQMLKNALHAEKLFYSLSRNKNKAALVLLKNDLILNRKTTQTTRTIQAHDLSGRSLITAHVASLEESIQHIPPNQLTSIALIQQTLFWHKTKTMNWNHETVVRGYLDYQRPRHVEALEINYQFQPVPGQLANVHTAGVGRYGTGYSGNIPNILEVFNKLTGQDAEKEKSLAHLLLRYKCGDGSALGEDSLRTAGMYLPVYAKERRTLVTQFNRAAYLICFQEVYRRKNQGYQQISINQIRKVPELPFGTAVACILKLLSDGFLRVHDVLETNSIYGVFTGTGVMNENFLGTLGKFSALFSFFVEKYAHQNYYLFEHSENGEKFNVAFTPQYFHKVLKQTDGGENESDGEEYEINAEESEDIEEIRDLLDQCEIESPQYRF